MRKCVIILFILLLSGQLVQAEEGMWIPMLLKKYNIEDMQRKGFKLTAEDIYDINNASLKDAVIGLGKENNPFHHFCTGEIISKEGLVVTNHHCAFSMIQSHTSLENNYLRDGFWAASKSEELTNPGITASILVRMEDVTEKVLSMVTENMTEAERTKAIEQVCRELETKAVEGTNLKANIKPYFNGNQYFMSVFRIFKDVRLVGAPPSAIGKFGGDTDNWVWPRHTGDFSVLRIYAGENNEPADYSANNQPYRPASCFKISTRGVKEGDFTFVFGYPGTTREYLPSFAVDQLVKVENPHKVAIRTAKLNIMNDAMNSDELLRIKYAAKAAGVANSWKKWQGETMGLERFRTVERKAAAEAEFQKWATGNQKYEKLVGEYQRLYQQRKDYVLAAVYAMEAGKGGSEIIRFAAGVYNQLKKMPETTDWEKVKAGLKENAKSFYKDYDMPTDRRILSEMLRLYNANLAPEWIPEEVKKAASAPSVYAGKLYDKSVFSQPEKVMKMIEQADLHTYKKLEKDGIYVLAASIDEFYKVSVSPELSRIDQELRVLNRLWLAGWMEMYPGKVFYPDANSTLRIAYGQVGGYSPVDAVKFKHYTTLKGIMEKDNPAIYDYDVPQKLRELYEMKDYGPYAENGEIPVCFIADNHTTGGNSGSPVINANGELIGINFDRAWEGVMSDIHYDPEICRNIAVDIRYVLFVIDKLAGAGHLIKEMEIVKE